MNESWFKDFLWIFLFVTAILTCLVGVVVSCLYGEAHPWVCVPVGIVSISTFIGLVVSTGEFYY